MKSIKYFFFSSLFLLYYCAGFAQNVQDYKQYNGKIIKTINIKTKRVDVNVIRHKFPLKEGDIFNDKDYLDAQDKLHNMRIFKKLDFNVSENDKGHLFIEINGEDGAYIFPLAFISGGSRQGAGITLAEGNYLKKGEIIYTFLGIGEDGIITILGANYLDYYANLKFENLNFERRYYQDNWVSTNGVFSRDKDKDDFSNPILQDNNRQDKFSLLFARTKNDITLFVQPEYYYINSDSAIDNGGHSNLTIGASYQKNMRQGINFGSLMGYGLSDKESALKDLPKNKFGFLVESTLKQGYAWTGSDYKITKLFLGSQMNLEFKNRNLILLYVKAKDSFGSPFDDKVQTLEIIGKFGHYTRQRYGRQGIGGGLTYVMYLIRNKVGLLSISPFYEFATVYANNRNYNQSGVGGNLSYKLWRFPFPIGINYTYNINDYSQQVSLTFGASF